MFNQNYSLLTGSSILALLVMPHAFAQTAPLQTELPEIVVTTPSPIQRPLLVQVRGRRDDRLNVVDQSFATVTFVTAGELLRNGGKTLGDQLSTQPGITNAGFAPGSAARPVIRGLDNFRVRVQENGIGAGDVSDLGEDHAVTIDPLAAQRVEVIRGPATLRFGSGAIGGVVSVDNDRIPSIQRPPGVSLETRTSVSSVDRGIEGAALMSVRHGNFAVHGDIYSRRSEDYSIPRSALSGRKQFNSFVRSNGQSIGGSYFLPDNGGFMGLSFTHFTSLYGIPGNDAPASRTRIDMEQFKLNGKGEFRFHGSPVEAIRYWIGGSVYKHKEEGLNGFGLFEPGAVFKNRELEARVEAQLAPTETSIGRLTNAVGIQLGRTQLGTSGEAGNLIQPANTQTVGAYLFSELQFLPTTRVQAAARIEHARVKGNGAIFPADFLGVSGAEIDDPRTRRFLPISASLGLLQELPFGFVGSLTGQYVQRAPRAAELYTRGAHDAPGTFEIGDTNLRKEVAKTIEIGLRRAAGPFRFEAAGYLTHYDGFIYRRDTGNTCDDDFASCGTGTELRQVVYTQRNAHFLGAEVKGQYDALEIGSNVFGVEAQYDIVRAKFTGDERVPRIPPHRIGGGVYWRGDSAWLAKVNLIHAFAVKSIAPEETPTKGYNLLNAELSYRTRLAGGPMGPVEITAGIAGTNLLNETIRNSVSFRKNEVVAPGRGIRGFVSMKF
jgi:iron complex outermembrane recepter protein